MRRRNVLSPSLFSFFFFSLTRGRIPAAVGGRCTWQDNKTCSASFGPLPVSTVGCEWSVNRVLIVVGRFWFIAVSKPRGEQRTLLHFGRPSSFRTRVPMVPGEEPKKSGDSERMDRWRCLHCPRVASLCPISKRHANVAPVRVAHWASAAN